MSADVSPYRDSWDVLHPVKMPCQAWRAGAEVVGEGKHRRQPAQSLSGRFFVGVTFRLGGTVVAVAEALPTPNVVYDLAHL